MQKKIRPLSVPPGSAVSIPTRTPKPTCRPELQRQLTFTTSSQKKRRITRKTTREQEPERASNTSSFAEPILPSTEEDPDPTFSFSATSTIGLTTPTYVRGDSLAASGVPSRLQSQPGSLASNDYASSAASSPCAASADLSIDNDRGDLDSLHPPGHRSTRSQSPFLVNASHRAIMSEAADQAHRSSSPLKRRASSMEPEQDTADGREDVDMLVLPDREKGQDERPNQDGTPTERSEVMDNGTPSLDQQRPKPELEIPPIYEQIKTIETIVKAFAETPLQEGVNVYLVSRRWLNKAQALGADGKHGTKETTIEALGPVDNADIIETIFEDALGQRCVKLKPGMGSENFEMFPEDAWALLEQWYGRAAGQDPIVRTAHNTAPDASSMPNIQVELHPPVFVLYRAWSAVSTIPIEQEIKEKKPAPPVVMTSSSTPFMGFLKKAKELTGVPMERKARLWRVIQTLPTTAPSPPSGIKTPPDSPSGSSSTVPRNLPITPGSWPEMLVDTETFTKLERGEGRDLVDPHGQDQTMNPNYNGKKSLALLDLTVDQILVIDEQVENTTWVTTASSLTRDKKLVSRGSTTSLTAQARGSGSGRASPVAQGAITRGRAQQKSGKSIGTTGLQNLGNTCYMNSALQCVRSVEELTKYFLTHEAKKEINADNPLSHDGEVAMAYGRLLEDLYKDPPLNSVAPRHFKSVIGRYAPSFSGYGQQDSQEFLGFLLDGLQEDLSRIKKKPYIEKPDSTDDMINNPEKIREMAEKVWDITKKRDDSVIADLFTGMYKSTLVCPECDKISITFDPFNNLTLPLPVQNVWSRNVKYFPLNDAPVEITVDLDKNSSMRALKQFISARVGVPTERLFGAEEFRDKFFKFYEDMASVSEEIQNTDHPVMFELEDAPTNLVAVKKGKKKQSVYRSLLNDDRSEEVPEWEDPMAERLLVPVMHRFSPEESSRKRFGRSKDEGEVPPPHFIIVTPEEARSEDMIRRKILEKVATFTTWPTLAAEEDSDNEEATDPELINTSSDADSSGDSKIVAKSVEGEEDIVDVTMTDAAEGKKVAPTGYTKQPFPTLLKRFKNKRPKWIRPDTFLEPELQNLFEVSYFKDPGSLLPTGWQNVQDESVFPRLSSRLPKPAASDTEMRSPGAWDGSEESGSDELSQAPTSSVTRMNDEESDDSDEFPSPMSSKFPARPPPVHLRNQQPPVSVRGKKKMKTYGKRGQKRFNKQERAARKAQPQHIELPDAEDTGHDGGPLVRLGEGLVVDWSEEVWSALFNGNLSSAREGMRTYQDLATLEDPALEAKKKQRQLRRKNGITLDDCLDEFEKEEILSEQDTWYCPRCKEHRRASKKFDLWKTPDILIVHLKRFSSSGWRRDKLDILVDFPIEALDLSQRVLDQKDGRQEVYDLIAVDDHWGGLGGGHYTAFAKNFIDGKWYEYNDASVSKLSDTSRVIGPAAYLLFYRRRSDVPLGGPRFQEIVDRYNQQGSDEEMTESGEDQRLGQGSSHRGSPSALTGAGLVLHQASHGSARGAQQDDDSFNAVFLQGTESASPAYRPSLSHVGEADERSDGDLLNDNALQNSIEVDDEAVDLPDYNQAASGAMQSTWNFENLTGKPGSEIAFEDDVGSNVAQNDNNSGTHEFVHEHENFDHVPMASVEGTEPGAEYVEPTEPSQAEFVEYVAPPADMDMGLLAEEIWDKKLRVHEVPADGGQDQASDKVAEIHVSDEEAAGSKVQS